MSQHGLPPDVAQKARRYFGHVFDLFLKSGADRAYQGAVLFLFLRHEGLLQSIAAPHPFYGMLGHWREQIARSMRDRAVLEIYDALEVPMSRLDPLIMLNILGHFQGMPEEFIGVHYPAVVDLVLSWVAKAGGKFSGGYDQPAELTELMLRLADVPQGGSIYNPFAGLASIGASLPPDAHYYGQEINMETWALGMIRLRAHRPYSHNQLYLENSLREWNRTGGQYDLVVANPPLNHRLQDEGIRGTFKHATAESLFLDRAFHDAKENGKVICIVAPGFLFNNAGDRRRFRHWLVGSGTLDTVITLPSGLLRNTAIPLALIVLDKGRGHNAPVRMVDASSFFQQVTRTERRLNVEAIAAILNGTEQHGVLRFVEQAEIHANDDQLLPTRYLTLPAEEIKDGVRLGKHATPAKLERFDPGTKAPFVRIRDLQEDPLEPMLQLDRAEVCEVPRHAKRLDRSALLLATRWSNLKPTWFEYTGAPIAVTNDILVLELDQDEVDVAYLVHELLSAKVQAQVEQLNRGLTVPSLRKQDILDILIEFPSKREQQAKVKGLREAHVEGLKRKAELEAERYGVELQRAGNTASLRHLLGTPLLNINSGVENIRFALDAMQPTWREHLISVREQMTLGDALDNLVHELQRVAALLETDSTELQVGRFPLEDLDLLAYLKATKRRVQLDLNGGHKVELHITEDIKEQLRGKAIVQGNKALLDMAIDALVDNARRHAFAGEPEPHMLEFGLSLDLTQPKRFLVLSVANNGKPFPEGFDLDRYRTKNMFAGETGHTGLGGYHVNEIVQWHKGWLELRSGKDHVGPYSTAIDLFIPLHQ